MNGATVVEDAARMCGALLTKEYRGPGDTLEAAMHRAERRWGIPAYTFWQLRYRRPRDIWGSVLKRIEVAYDREVARAEARLAREIELTREGTGDAAREAAIRAAEALLASAAGED